MRRTEIIASLALLPLAMANAQTTIVTDYRESVSPQTLTWQVAVPPFSVEHQVRLVLEARIDWPELSGSDPWISLTVNGNLLGLVDLLNKTPAFLLRNGVDLSWYDAGRWRLLYSPDFEAAVADKQTPYGVESKDEPYRFVWDITRHVKPGPNQLTIEHHKVLQKPDTLVLRNVAIEAGKRLYEIRMPSDHFAIMVRRELKG